MLPFSLPGYLSLLVWCLWLPQAPRAHRIRRWMRSGGQIRETPLLLLCFCTCHLFRNTSLSFNFMPEFPHSLKFLCCAVFCYSRKASAISFSCFDVMMSATVSAASAFSLSISRSSDWSCILCSLILVPYSPMSCSSSSIRACFQQVSN